MSSATPILLLWRPAGKEIGHAALLTGKYYVSFWPDGDIKQLGAKKAMSSGVPACLVTHFEADFELEEGRKPKVYPMLNVDATDLNLMIEKFLRFNGIADPEEFTLSAVESRMLDQEEDFEPKISLSRTKYSFDPALQLINPFVMMTEDEEILRIDSEPFEWPNDAESCTSFCYHLVEFVRDANVCRELTKTSVTAKLSFEFICNFLKNSPFTVDEFEYVVISFYSHTEGTNKPRAALHRKHKANMNSLFFSYGLVLFTFYAFSILRLLFFWSSWLSDFTIFISFFFVYYLFGIRVVIMSAGLALIQLLYFNYIFGLLGWSFTILAGSVLIPFLLQYLKFFASILNENMLYEKNKSMFHLVTPMRSIASGTTNWDTIKSFTFRLVLFFLTLPLKCQYSTMYIPSFNLASAVEEFSIASEAHDDEDNPYSSNWKPDVSERIVREEHQGLWNKLLK